MALDPRTALAPDCSDCGDLALPAIDTASVLSRLPAALINRAQGEDPTPELLAGDILGEDTLFGPLGGGGTPQWALARILAEEAGAFVLGWRTAEALQLAIGEVRTVDGRLVSQCPHARREDLDRLGAQFGIARPNGFSDCCYWRLVHLILFQPGPTTWRLAEIAALYTGVRPLIAETQARVRLTWPVEPSYGVPGAAYFNHAGYFDRVGHWVTDASAPAAELDGYWGDGAWWDTSAPAAGLPLREALDLAKPAGVYVALVNVPQFGRAGCSGATTRAPGSGRGFWSLAPADVAAQQIGEVLGTSQEGVVL